MEQFIADYGYLALALGLLAENTIIIGTFFPGTTLSFIAAFSAGAGALNITLVALIMFAVLVAGDTISFMIGRQLAPRMPKLKTLINKQLHHVNREPSISFAGLFYQFISTIKSLLPLFLGSSRTSFSKWIRFNVAASAIYTILISGSGFYAGRFVGDLASTQSTFIGVQVVSISAVIAISLLYGVRSLRNKDKQSESEKQNF